MWGVGCIFFEMVGGRPLFPGSTVEDELHLIFKVLGTPTEKTWPGIAANKDFGSYKFPRYPTESFVSLAPRLDPDGVKLLAKLLRFQGATRISASEALRDNYFNSLGPIVHTLRDTDSIMEIEGISLVKDPGLRSSLVPGSGDFKKGLYRGRRQSMLF